MMNHALDLNWTVPQPGTIIAGKYVVERECGRGGLAVVLLAHHAELDRRVAIKMLLPVWAGDRDVIDRFLREGRAATRISSEHVVRVFDVGIFETGAPYLVLEFLEGHNLDEVVRTWGMLPVPTAIDWLLQASEAIAEAHVYGIVHRDLKPSNLFLTQRADGTASIKVIDFGLSKITDPRMRAPGDKLTQATDIMGSPHYMAPEQLRSTRETDARTDVWALGVVLFELLTGRPPFCGDSVPELCANVLTQPPPRVATLRPNVPPAVEGALFRCLQKDPNARFASVAEMARALAPYGTKLARASCDRIERTLGVSGGNGRFSGISLLPPMPTSDAANDSWADEVDGRALSTPASARVVLGSLFMLSGLFVAVFLWVYTGVHGHEFRLGAAEGQATTDIAPPPAPQAAATTAMVAPATQGGPGLAPASPASATVPPADPSLGRASVESVTGTPTAPASNAAASFPAPSRASTGTSETAAVARPLSEHAPEHAKGQHEPTRVRATGSRSASHARAEAPAPDARQDDSAGASSLGFPTTPAMPEPPSEPSPRTTPDPPAPVPSAADPTTYVPPAGATPPTKDTAPVPDDPYGARQ